MNETKKISRSAKDSAAWLSRDRVSKYACADEFTSPVTEDLYLEPIVDLGA